MSVLTCGRYGCGNIMCDRLILESSSYICERCYQELLAYKTTWKQEGMHVSDVKARIENFMETKVGTYRGTDRGVGIDEEFERLAGGFVRWEEGDAET